MFLNIMLAPVYITEYLWAEMLFTKIIWTYRIITATKKIEVMEWSDLFSHKSCGALSPLIYRVIKNLLKI
jgi:hypothetical protein